MTKNRYYLEEFLDFLRFLGLIITAMIVVSGVSILIVPLVIHLARAYFRWWGL